MSSRRRLARVAVMQTLFELDIAEQTQREGIHPRGRDAVQVLTRNIAEIGETEKIDRAFAEKLLMGIQEHHADIRAAIQNHAPQWPLGRMDRISRALLMIGAEELLFGGDAPPAVIMNECIDIAKEFGEEESGRFVNGVLNAIAHA